MRETFFMYVSARADEGVTGNQALNIAYDTFAEGRDLWGPATAEYFAPLDVAGYNYKTARYTYDGEKYPDRVIYGSESYPRVAFQSWTATEENSHVIGDFVWTAWDYIGEVDVGRWEISDESRPGPAGYPWLLANCSDIDLLGRKRSQSCYLDVVWNCADGPRLFCLPPELTGKNIARLSWGGCRCAAVIAFLVRTGKIWKSISMLMLRKWNYSRTVSVWESTLRQKRRIYGCVYHSVLSWQAGGCYL